VFFLRLLARVMGTVQQHDEERGMKSNGEIEAGPSWSSRLRLRGSKLKLTQTIASTPALGGHQYRGSCLLQNSETGANFELQQGLQLPSHT
jgi:hypothetical protein